MSPIISINTASKPLSVTQLNRQSKNLLERQFSQVQVEGEISNLATPSSGHIYFSLKDANAQIRCAWFKGSQGNHSQWLKNGAHVVTSARVSLYEPRGDYQLIINSMIPAGIGKLQAQYEALKLKLDKLGLFEQSRKKPIPRLPQTIAIIASAHSAALKDVLSTLKRRYCAVQLLLIPSEVQGENAPSQLIKAIELANQQTEIDSVIIARGGGSIEDLWAFNDEQLAYAIANCHHPVITGIGHEIDFTIADFVADYRAPTPTAAAEAASLDQLELLDKFNNYHKRLQQLLTNRTKQLHQIITHLLQRLISPTTTIKTWWQKLDLLETAINHALAKCTGNKQTQLIELSHRLEQQNPAQILAQHRLRLDKLQLQLTHAIEQQMLRLKQTLQQRMKVLQAYSPLATLERGYTITLKDDKVVTSVTSLTESDRIIIKFHDGDATCEVT